MVITLSAVKRKETTKGGEKRESEEALVFITSYRSSMGELASCEKNPNQHPMREKGDRGQSVEGQNEGGKKGAG